MRNRANALWTAGSITRKQEGSLAKPPAKGYQPTWAVDQGTDGLEQMGGREKRAPTGNRGCHGDSPLPAARSSPSWSVKALRATVCPTEARRMMRGGWRVHPRTKHGQGMAGSAVAAMAGGQGPRSSRLRCLKPPNAN